MKKYTKLKQSKKNEGKCNKNSFLQIIIILEVNILIVNIIYMHKTDKLYTLYNSFKEIDKLFLNSITSKYNVNKHKAMLMPKYSSVVPPTKIKYIAEKI